MSHHCLICESSAALNQETAKAIVLVVAALDGFVRGWHEPQPSRDTSDVPLGSALLHVSRAVSSAVAACSGHVAFAQDLEKYQFAGFNCLCQRCGALFDSPPDTQSAL